VFSVNGVALDGTTSDGRRIYVCTVEIAADASTKMRGIMQDDDGTNAVSNLDSDLVIGTMDVGETVKIAWDISSENLLTGSFTAASTTDPVQAGEALDASSGTLGLSLHTDGKYYKYQSGSKADLQGLLPRGQNIALDASFTITWLNGIVTTESGLTADTVYHVQDGGTLVTTATSTTKLAGKSRGTTILVGNQNQGIESLTDGDVTTGTATVPSLITAEQVKLGVESFGGSGFVGTALESFNNSFVCIYSVPSFAAATIGPFFGAQTVNEKFGMVAFGNGVAMTIIKLSLKKVGSPTDNVVVRIETDSSGEPSGTLVDANATGTVAMTGLTTSLVDTTVTFGGSFTIADNTKCWLVLSRSGAINVSNFPQVGTSRTYGQSSLYNATWAAGANERKLYFDADGLKTSGLYENILDFSTVDGSSDVSLLGFVASGTAGDTVTANTSASVTGLSGLIPDTRYSLDGQTPEVMVDTAKVNHLTAYSATEAVFTSYPHIT